MPSPGHHERKSGAGPDPGPSRDGADSRACGHCLLPQRLVVADHLRGDLCAYGVRGRGARRPSRTQLPTPGSVCCTFTHSATGAGPAGGSGGSGFQSHRPRSVPGIRPRGGLPGLPGHLGGPAHGPGPGDDRTHRAGCGLWWRHTPASAQWAVPRSPLPGGPPRRGPARPIGEADGSAGTVLDRLGDGGHAGAGDAVVG